MDAKTKRGDVRATSSVAQGCKSLLLLSGFLLILLLGGCFVFALSYGPHDTDLVWSSDSRYLLVTRDYSKHYMYDLARHTEDYVVIPPPEIQALFGANQENIFHLSNNGYIKDGIWAEIPDFEPTSNLFPGADGGNPNPYTFSPNKKWILNYQRMPDAVWEKTSQEGDSVQTHRLVSQSRPDGLYLLPVDGHTKIRLIQNGPFEDIAWSPDGCYIAYSQSVPPRLSIVLASDWGLGEFIKPGTDCRDHKASSIFG